MNVKRLKLAQNSAFFNTHFAFVNLSYQHFLQFLKSKCAKITFSEFFPKENYLFQLLSFNFREILFQINFFFNWSKSTGNRTTCNININQAVQKTSFTLSNKFMTKIICSEQVILGQNCQGFFLNLLSLCMQMPSIGLVLLRPLAHQSKLLGGHLG